MTNSIANPLDLLIEEEERRLQQESALNGMQVQEGLAAEAMAMEGSLDNAIGATEIPVADAAELLSAREIARERQLRRLRRLGASNTPSSRAANHFREEVASRRPTALAAITNKDRRSLWWLLGANADSGVDPRHLTGRSKFASLCQPTEVAAADAAWCGVVFNLLRVWAQQLSPDLTEARAVDAWLDRCGAEQEEDEEFWGIRQWNADTQSWEPITLASLVEASRATEQLRQSFTSRIDVTQF